MIKGFEYFQPVEIIFGQGKIKELNNILNNKGYKKGVLICDRIFILNGLSERLLAENFLIKSVFTDLSPNPLLSEVCNAVKIIKENDADFVIAMGGGSCMDVAKFACSMAYASGDIRDYFYGRKLFEAKKVSLILVPTTAGTGSEVTSVSVCNDEINGIKAPMNHKNFFADIALIDPELTLSVPQNVTADTGIDALSHALEGFWSKNHQPISDMFAFQSCKLILDNLLDAYNNGQNTVARQNMSLGALYAGLAFALTKTAGCHACSYPISINYKLSHGQACGLTLDSFIRINKNAENKRLEEFSKSLGYSGADALAEKVKQLKKAMGMKCSLSDYGITDIKKLAYECSIHPLMSNNPVKLGCHQLKQMFELMQ